MPDVGADVAAGRDGDDVVADVHAAHAERRHHRGRQPDVGRRHQRRRQPQPQATVEERADQHQRRQVLAGHVAGDGQVATSAQRARHRDRQAAVALAPRRPSRRARRRASCSGPIGRRAQRRVAVDRDRARGERGEGGDEPRRGAGQAGMERARRRRRSRPPAAGDVGPVARTPTRRRRGGVRQSSIAAVSSPPGTPARWLSPSARAAQTRARLAMLFEPGTSTTASSGRVALARRRTSVTGQLRRVTAGRKPRAIRPPR